MEQDEEGGLTLAAGPDVDASFLDEAAASACCLSAVSLPPKGEPGLGPLRLATSSCTRERQINNMHCINNIHRIAAGITVMSCSRILPCSLSVIKPQTLSYVIIWPVWLKTQKAASLWNNHCEACWKLQGRCAGQQQYAPSMQDLRESYPGLSAQDVCKGVLITLLQFHRRGHLHQRTVLPFALRLRGSSC